MQKLLQQNLFVCQNDLVILNSLKGYFKNWHFFKLKIVFNILKLRYIDTQPLIFTHDKIYKEPHF